jgi:protein-disulfide isomerase
MVIFNDFQCPYCRAFAKTIRENVPAKYPNDVRVIFEDFPIPSLHQWAMAAAEAGRCVSAANPASFWPFHDWIFEHQGEITSENLKDKVLAFAPSQKLDPTAIGNCLSTHAMAPAVQKTIRAGESLGVQQTPTFFINGRMIGGALPWDSPNGSLKDVIQLELNRPAEVPGPVAPR